MCALATCDIGARGNYEVYGKVRSHIRFPCHSGWLASCYNAPAVCYPAGESECLLGLGNKTRLELSRPCLARHFAKGDRPFTIEAIVSVMPAIRDILTTTEANRVADDVAAIRRKQEREPAIRRSFVVD
jgi:hypothetical protein